MAKTYPKNIVLSRDEYVRAGKYEIGWWSKEVVCSSPHFRPSQYEGMTCYYAKLNNDEFVRAWNKEDLRSEIEYKCRDGIDVNDKR